METILIIGSSYSIKDTFKKKFNNQSVTFLSFREIWSGYQMKKYDIIILSGFHHYKICAKYTYYINYIKQYYDFILEIEKNCNKLFVISTFIPSKISFSRVVYFYREISKRIINRRKIKIISFKKILFKGNKNIFYLKILQIIGYEFTNQEDLVNNLNQFILNRVPNTKFYFIKIRKKLIFERLLRFLDYD